MNKQIAISISLLVLVYPYPAFAYFDVSTASMLLQAALAGIAGGLMVLKLYWRAVVEFFCKLKTSLERGRPKT